MKNRQKWFLLAATAVLAGGGVLTVHLVRNPREAVRAIPVDRGRVVRTLHLKMKKKTFLISAYGTVRPRNEIKVVAEVSGRVIYRSDGFRSGGFVEKGDTLFGINPVDYKLGVARRRAEIAQLRADIGKLVQEKKNYGANLAIAKRHLSVVQGQLKRNQRLGKQNVISAGKIDISLQAVLRQEREVQRIHNHLALVAPSLLQKEASLEVTQARLEEANLNLSRTRITAPFDARVRNTNLEVGNYIREGNTVGTIYDSSVLEVPVSIPVEESRWAFRRPGSAQFPKTQGEVQKYFPRAKIYWSRFGQKFEWDGRVTLVGAGLDEATRAFTLVIEVPEPTRKWVPGYHPPLTVGMFVTVGIEGVTMPDVYTIPRSALHQGDKIYLLKNSKLDIRTVQVIRKRKNEVVFKNGVADGDRLILSAIPAAVMGMKLRPEGEDVGGVAEKKALLGRGTSP